MQNESILLNPIIFTRTTQQGPLVNGKGKTVKCHSRVFTFDIIFRFLALNLAYICEINRKYFENDSRCVWATNTNKIRKIFHSIDITEMTSIEGKIKTYISDIRRWKKVLKMTNLVFFF